MWTDGTTVLQWLHFIDKRPVFVANITRVAEIFERPFRQFLAQRSQVLDDSWLAFQTSQEILRTKLKNFDSNEATTKTVYQETTTNTASVASNVLTLEWRKYSSYEKLSRIVVYILRISPKFSGNKTETGAITDPVEFEIAEQKLCFLVKSESFPNETKNLLKSCPWSKPSIIKDFSPFIGPNGLLCSQGRTKHLEVANFDVKHPILLDSRHPVVRLFLEHLHDKHCHQGVEYLSLDTAKVHHCQIENNIKYNPN